MAGGPERKQPEVRSAPVRGYSLDYTLGYTLTRPRVIAGAVTTGLTVTKWEAVLT